MWLLYVYTELELLLRLRGERAVEGGGLVGLSVGWLLLGCSMLGWLQIHKLVKLQDV